MEGNDHQERKSVSHYTSGEEKILLLGKKQKATSRTSNESEKKRAIVT